MPAFKLFCNGSYHDLHTLDEASYGTLTVLNPDQLFRLHTPHNEIWALLFLLSVEQEAILCPHIMC